MWTQGCFGLVVTNTEFRRVGDDDADPFLPRSRQKRFVILIRIDTAVQTIHHRFSADGSAVLISAFYQCIQSVLRVDDLAHPPFYPLQSDDPAIVSAYVIAVFYDSSDKCAQKISLSEHQHFIRFLRPVCILFIDFCHKILAILHVLFS